MKTLRLLLWLRWRLFLHSGTAGSRWASLGVGLLLVPGMMRVIRSIDRKETTLVAAVGFCFIVSLIAREFGYSVALGAFLAGSLIAESGEEKEVEHLVEPVRDMFAAIFFVSVGMMIDPSVVLDVLARIA